MDTIILEDALKLVTAELWARHLEGPLGAPDARAIWGALHRACDSDDRLDMLVRMARWIDRECASGKRCPVCGAYGDPSCYTEC